MKLAFYKAEGTLFNKLIRLKTGSQYSHVEFVFNEVNPLSPFIIRDDIQQGDGRKVGNHLCYSSSSTDGGVRFKWINLYDGKWDRVDTGRLGRLDLQIALSICGSKVGLRYDWLGILGFVLPFGEHDDDDRFCSEICTELIQTPPLAKFQIAEKKLVPWKTSPGDLYKAVTT